MYVLLVKLLLSTYSRDVYIFLSSEINRLRKYLQYLKCYVYLLILFSIFYYHFLINYHISFIYHILNDMKYAIIIYMLVLILNNCP